MSGDDFDPSRFAHYKLFHHIVEKGWQGGAFIGLAAVLPVIAYRSPAGFLNAIKDPMLITKAAAYGSLGGATFSGVLGAARITQLDREGVEDRVYRLHYNEGQNRCDTFAEVGMAVGAAAAAYFLGPAVPMNIVGGAALGTAGGVLLHVATRPADKTPNKMIHEIKT